VIRVARSRPNPPARNLKATTVRNYRSSLERHLLPFFGGYGLTKLEAEPELVDRFIAQKMREGLSPKTVSNLVIDLGVILKQAVRWRLMRSNPVRDAERPRIEPPEMQVLTEAEIAALAAAYAELERDAPEGERAWWALARTITFVALGTALRRGELLALRWRDVRMLEGLLQVREALVASRFTTPKSCRPLSATARSRSYASTSRPASCPR
jgi:integrase